MATDAATNPSFPNYTETQRIVLLIDLNPILNLQNPNPYIKTLINFSESLLNFPPLSSSLFSFKPFFSSLSPLLSSSKLPFFPSNSLSFNHKDSTFDSLTSFLNSLPTTINKESFPLYPSRASNIAASLRQLVHDYAWDPVDGTLFDKSGSIIRSNLVILLSPVYELVNQCLNDKEFFRVFESVNGAFVSRDVHCCWVDVKFQSLENVDLENLVFLKNGIKSLGWGFCSSDSIVLGSAIVPFGLIYPNIAVSSNIFNADSGRKGNAQLSLEILDANGKPLECNCCELDFVDLKMFNNQKNSSVLDQYLDRVTKLRVRVLRRFDECEKIEGRFVNPIMVRESLRKCGKDRKGDSGEFYGDRVLQILARDMDESLMRKPVGIWQILLSFLYREGYCAFVSLSDGDSDLHTGILKPFTVFSAMLCIIRDGKMNENCRLHVDSRNDLGVPDSQSQSSHSHKFTAKRKKNKRRLILPHDWSGFCEATGEHSEIDLEASYFSRDTKSKKLKFLKCWMKQVQKLSPSSFVLQESAKPNQDATEETNHAPIELPQDSEGFSRVLDEAGNNFCSGTSEDFFDSLPNKIKEGVESEEVELGAFAERLVRSSIYWLYQKHETEYVTETQTSSVKTSDGCASKVAVEVIKLLLMEPKDLVAMHKKNNPSSHASDSRAIGSASVSAVREYELQILFRMEILQSEVGAIIEESMKQKFVKQICKLLESIQCHLDCGFFGDWRLDKYVEKIIKSRYYLSLGDVVDRIYTRMDVLASDDEDGLPNHVFNSEDSNRSWKEKPVSIEKESPQPKKYGNKRSHQATRSDEHELELIQAGESRQRARRISSFTSWMPDLKRLWAPKQPKAMKPKKLAKRGNRRSKASYDTVCETPMTGKKRSSPYGNTIDDDEGYGNCRAQPHGTVSKALFQDDIQ